MPRYQTLQPDEIEDLKKQGLDPEKYLYDAEAGDLISRLDVPEMTVMEKGLETLKAAGGGFLSGIAGIPRGVEKLLSTPERAAAASLESMVQGGQLTDSPELQRRIGAMQDPGMLGRALTGASSGIESLKPDVDPRLGWLPRMTGEFGGTAASLLVPGGGARYLGAGPKMAGALTTGLAGSQIFGNVSAAEEARQKEAGETPSDTKEILKAAGVTGAMLPLYHLLGPSRFFNSTAPAGTLGELGKRIGVHALSGGGLAGTQRALEDAVIAGEVNPADIGKSIVAGGLAQGLTGAGAEYYSARNAPPAAKATVDTTAVPVPPAEPQAPKPKALPEVTRLTDDQVDVLLRLPPGELPPNNGPVHKAIDKGKAEGWVRTPEDVRILEDAVISAPKDMADAALKAAMDGLWYKNVANRPAPSAEEAARNIQAGYYEFFNETFPGEVKALSAGRKNLEGMRKWVEKLQKDAAKAQETGQLGFATDAQTQMQAALENIKRAETDVRAKEMDLLRQWNAKHAPVNPPAAPMPAPIRPAAPAPTPAPAQAPVQPVATPKPFIPPIQTDDPSILNPRRPLEGEQGSPFGEQTRYSGFFPPTLLEKIADFSSKEIKNSDFAKFDPFSAVSRSVTSRMAGLSPSGGMMKWAFDGKLRPMRDAYSNELVARAAEFESFVKSAEGKAWIERSNSTGTWDFAGLTPEQAKQAQALVDTIEWTRDNATAKGVWVKDIDNAGNVTYRPGEKQPGWFPFMPSDKVYEAAARDNAEWKQFKKDFITHWEAQRGPGSTEQALEALRNFIPSLDNGIGGEPLFSPLILPAGMTLPESWRSENLMDSWNRYSRRYAQHMAWAENVQNDPVGRRLFGLQENGKGERDTAEVTWADVPDAWKYAVREGKRVRAKWALSADPNKPPAESIEPFMEGGLTRDMMASYRQGNSSAPLLQAGSAATSSVILGILSGVRDVGMSTVLSGTYGEYGKTLHNAVRYLADPKGEKAKARGAGAMQADLLSPEVAATGKVFGRALLTIAQKMRRLGGPISREELDNMGRVVIFETARQLILEGRPSGKALVEEFGPAYTAGLTLEQIADQTAARLSSRQSGTSDASNLPGWMLPQTGNPLGHFFALGRWSAARYNNFVEDTWNPFVEGKTKQSAERFFKLALGGLVVSSAIQGLINVLFDRKPDNLTWGEFLNILGDPKTPAGKKASEAAYLMAANTQLLGSFGWVGDLVLAGVRSAAGGKTQGKPLDTQYPALIFANQMYNTLASYLDALRDKRANLGIHDLTALMWEIAKGAQNGKLLARMAELGGVKDVAEKREIRNQRVYERVLGQQTGSARPVSPDTARELPSVTDPFAAQNRFLNMAPERFGDYREFLLGRRAGGKPYQLSANWLQHPSYYGNLARITGENAAEEEKKRDRAMEQEILRRNAALLKVK